MFGRGYGNFSNFSRGSRHCLSFRSIRFDLWKFWILFMSVIVEGLDFVLDLLKGNTVKTAYGHQTGQSGFVMLSYISVVFFWCYVWA